MSHSKLTPEKNSATDNSALTPEVWKIAAVTLLGSFISQLDASLINVSLSNLATDLHTSLTTIQWVTSGYLLALTLMLPLNAWLVSRIGAKAVYLGCFASFTLTSALCGLAWSANSLIGFRILQGISGGLLAPMAQTLLARAAGKNLTKIVGFIAVPVLLAPVLGPVIAGAILHASSWRWLFLINLPFGALGLLLAIRFLPHDESAAPPHKLDWLGLSLLSPGLVLFLYSAEYLTQTYGPWSLFASLVLIAAFILHARQKGRRALLDIQLFSGKTFSAAAITQFLSNGVSFAAMLVIPVYLIQGCGYSAGEMGWMLLPMGLGMMCANPLMGQMTQRFGIRHVSATGALMALLGTLAFIFMASHYHAAKALNLPLLVTALFVRGAGLVMIGLPSMSAAYNSVSCESLPMATTTLNIAQRLGGPALTTLCAVFLQWRLNAATADDSRLPPYVAVFILLSAMQMLTLIVTLRLPRWLDQQKRGR